MDISQAIPTPIPIPMIDARLQAMLSWLSDLNQTKQLALLLDSIHPASSDASFRRYFRIYTTQGFSYVVMDAPPPMEDVTPFVMVGELFKSKDANQAPCMPTILAKDAKQGFLLLSDLGSTTYMHVLDTNQPEQAYALYQSAINTLIDMQQLPSSHPLPIYHHQRLYDEMQLCIDWYIEKHLNYALSSTEKSLLQQVFNQIIANNVAQKQVFVHRDYHCRNLMHIDLSNDAQSSKNAINPDNQRFHIQLHTPGILDFQDAVYGPITYDLASLFRDAYIEWPEAFQLECLIYYWEHCRSVGIELPAFDQFYIDYEWMGLQRHLKILGIFARLYHRDGKSNYLNDLPLVLKYVLHTANRYEVFKPLAKLLERITGAAVTNSPSKI